MLICIGFFKSYFLFFSILIFYLLHFNSYVLMFVFYALILKF
ncbi:hypothetical protein HMPREF1419_00231 [Helicobacter pylori GAM263BFi]|nr:hypothetical protein HMPREF1419_00231 [Helicobacter pylori GAM263BFi]